jgi:hypothetical protein
MRKKLIYNFNKYIHKSQKLGIYWTCYEWLKLGAMTLRWPHTQQSTLVSPFPVAFLAGMVSGSVAATLTLPFDVIKTHRQIELGQINGAGSNSIGQKNGTKNGGGSRSTLAMMRELVATKGAGALFTGIYYETDLNLNFFANIRSRATGHQSIHFN